MSKEKIKEEFAYNPEDQMKDFFKSNKEDFFNDEPDYDYTISSGSLKLDKHMKGGIGPGIIRFVGTTEGGKSSCAFAFVRNFLKHHDNARAVAVPSEGRLNVMMKNRADLPFVRKIADWKNKTCLVAETPIYETCMNMVRDLIMNNPTNTRYIFVIDSIDALNPKEDYIKPFGQNMKVAGQAALTSDFLKKMAMIVASKGHVVILISQVRSNIKISQYETQNDNVNVDSGTGGNALLHYSNWILEFAGHNARADRIWEGEPGKSEIKGHFCEIKFCKTPNEKTGTIVKYPIRYGQTGQKAIWTSYEVADELLAWGQVKRDKAWIYVNDKTVEYVKEKGGEIPEKFHGMEKFQTYLEDMPEVTNILEQRLKDVTIW